MALNHPILTSYPEVAVLHSPHGQFRRLKAKRLSISVPPYHCSPLSLGPLGCYSPCSFLFLPDPYSYRYCPRNRERGKREERGPVTEMRLTLSGGRRRCSGCPSLRSRGDGRITDDSVLTIYLSIYLGTLAWLYGLSGVLGVFY
jgi:hypothetical protein